MKLCILIIAIFVTASSCSEDYPASKVPSVVHNTIKAKFPGALDIDWKKNADSYEAEFDLNGIEYTAFVEPAGKLISYKHEIKAAESCTRSISGSKRFCGSVHQ